jgi:predicted RNA-binding protein YlqC (UPF0109 family)
LHELNYAAPLTMETERDSETENAQLLREIVASYTSRTDEIEIDSKQAGRLETLQLRVAKEDYPKVAGKWQKQIQSLRVTFQFIGARNQKTVRLLLLEPEQQQPDGAPQRETPEIDAEFESRFGHLLRPEAAVKPPSTYNPETIRALAEKVLGRVLIKPFTTEIYDAEDKVQLDAFVEQSELELAQGIEPYLRPLFHAAGKKQGRNLYFEVKPKVEIPM